MTLSLMSGFLHGLICNEEFDCTYHEILSGTEEFVSNTIGNVYPNPADHVIFIPYSSNQSSSTVYSSDGKKVAEVREASFNTSALAEGVYLVETIGLNGESIRERVIIAH
jgi:hypothetical protein